MSSELLKVSFSRTKTKAEALAAGEDGCIYFPTDADCIVCGGREMSASTIAQIAGLTEALAGKQPTIQNLQTVISNSELGATAVQPSEIEDMATQTWVSQQGYISADEYSEGAGDIVNVEEDILGILDTSEIELATKDWVSGQNFVKSSDLVIDSNDIAWNNSEARAEGISAVEYGCTQETSTNKLAYLPGNCITVEYTQDGGTTWSNHSYNSNSLNKTKLVTTGDRPFEVIQGNYSSLAGTASAYIINGIHSSETSYIGNHQLRIIINSRDAEHNQATRKWVLPVWSKRILIKASSQGAQSLKVKVQRRSMQSYTSGTNSWTECGVYNITAVNWNSIPFDFCFSGEDETGLNKIEAVSLTFFAEQTGNDDVTSHWSIDSIHMIGINYGDLTNYNNLAKTGHLYQFDSNKIARFPSTVQATDFKQLVYDTNNLPTYVPVNIVYDANNESDLYNKVTNAINSNLLPTIKYRENSGSIDVMFRYCYSVGQNHYFGAVVELSSWTFGQGSGIKALLLELSNVGSNPISISMQ